MRTALFGIKKGTMNIHECLTKNSDIAKFAHTEGRIPHLEHIPYRIHLLHRIHILILFNFTWITFLMVCMKFLEILEYPKISPNFNELSKLAEIPYKTSEK